MSLLQAMSIATCFALFVMDIYAEGTVMTAVQVCTLLNWCCCCSMTVVVSVRSKRIKQLLSSLSTSISYDSVTRVKRQSQWFLCLSMLAVLIDVGTSYGAHWSDYREIATTLIALTIELPLCLNQFFVVYPSFYLCLLQLLTDYEVSQLRLMMKVDMSLDSGTGMKAMMSRRERVKEMKQEFESLLNFIPFTLFALPFSTIPGMVSGVTQERGLLSMYSGLSYAATHTWIFLFIVLIVIRVSKARRETTHASAQVISLLQQRFTGRLHETGFQSLIEELRIDQEFSFTGCSLFDIATRLIPPFCSSLVTMSVLLIQLSAKLYASSKASASSCPLDQRATSILANASTGRLA